MRNVGYIDTSEDFIKYAASQSSFTGRPYRVRCGTSDETTASWLTQALILTRRQAAPGQNQQNGEPAAHP